MGRCQLGQAVRLLPHCFPFAGHLHRPERWRADQPDMPIQTRIQESWETAHRKRLTGFAGMPELLRLTSITTEQLTNAFQAQSPRLRQVSHERIAVGRSSLSSVIIGRESCVNTLSRVDNLGEDFWVHGLKPSGGSSKVVQQGPTERSQSYLFFLVQCRSFQQTDIWPYLLATDELVCRRHCIQAGKSVVSAFHASGLNRAILLLLQKIPFWP
jgi:hypothetical protein